jgi:hypothetical protein
MPWTPDDAERHTHKATTSVLKELWAKVANECLERTGDEGRSIREANAVVVRWTQPDYSVVVVHKFVSSARSPNLVGRRRLCGPSKKK